MPLLATLTAVGLGVGQVARERHAKTLDFLLVRPIAARTIVWTKFLAGSLVLLLVVAALVGLGYTDPGYTDTGIAAVRGAGGRWFWRYSPDIGASMHWPCSSPSWWTARPKPQPPRPSAPLACLDWHSLTRTWPRSPALRHGCHSSMQPAPSCASLAIRCFCGPRVSAYARSRWAPRCSPPRSSNVHRSAIWAIERWCWGRLGSSDWRFSRPGYPASRFQPPRPPDQTAKDGGSPHSTLDYFSRASLRNRRVRRGHAESRPHR